MKKTIICFLLALPTLLMAQVTNEGTPKSWQWNKPKSLQSIAMPAFDLKAMQEEDARIDPLQDRPWRFGKDFAVDYHLNNAGEWTTLENGDRVWRIRFQSEGAITLNFLFEDFYLPTGGHLYLYNDSRTSLLGAYDYKQNNTENVLGTWLVDGDNVWIEYFEPAAVKNQGRLKIGKVVHGYRSQSQFTQEKGLNDSGDCNHDVDCPIGEFENFKNHNKKGTAILLSGGQGFCSGSLINNTANDKKPYLLTANHCFSNPANWAFRFNWISPNPVCATTQNSTNGPTTQTLSGAQLRARRQPSDFCLVEINNPIPDNWDVVWNGWDRTDVIPTKTWGLHHPSGDIMKVCVDDNAPQKRETGGEPVWRVLDWDLGVTEGGSSGSPLFDHNGKIIGQLWRGVSACSGTNDNNQYDEYGRFGISWAAGTAPAQRLQDWLDPVGTNPMTLEALPPFEPLSTNQDEFASQINVYPNPVAGVVTIANATGNKLSYQIYNALGKTIAQGEMDGINQSLDLNKTAAGVLFIKLTNMQTNQTTTKKLVIK